MFFAKVRNFIMVPPIVVEKNIILKNAADAKEALKFAKRKMRRNNYILYKFPRIPFVCLFAIF